MTTIAAFLKQGWADHVDHPQDVAARLAQGIALVGESADDATGLIRLAGHTLLGHLGDVDRTVALLPQLESLSTLGDAPRAALARLKTTLSLVDPSITAPQGLSASELIPAHQAAILALEWRGEYARAGKLVEAVLELAEADESSRVGAGPMLSGLAYHLWYWPERNPARNQLTIDAALAVLRVQQAGTDWLETGRAHYRVSLAYAQAAQANAAMEHAEQYMRLCTKHGADSYERFFVHEAIARAHSAAGKYAAVAAEQEKMAELLDEISDPGHVPYCREVLQSLRAL